MILAKNITLRFLLEYLISSRNKNFSCDRIYISLFDYAKF